MRFFTQNVFASPPKCSQQHAEPLRLTFATCGILFLGTATSATCDCSSECTERQAGSGALRLILVFVDVDVLRALLQISILAGFRGSGSFYCLFRWKIRGKDANRLEIGCRTRHAVASLKRERGFERLLNCLSFARFLEWEASG